MKPLCTRFASFAILAAVVAVTPPLRAGAPEPPVPAVAEKPAAVVADEDFRTLTLTSGLKVDVPKDWNAVRGSDSQPIEKVSADFLKPQVPAQDGASATWLQALGDGGQVSFAIRTASVVPAVEQPQSMSAADLTHLRESILHNDGHRMRDMNDLSELKVVRFGTKWAIEYHYQLPALPGGQADSVDEYQVIENHQALHFIFSRPTAATVQWQPVFDHIRGSIRFPGGSTEASAAAKSKKAGVEK